ncbi:hypothetical protein ACFWFF_33165 [Streptomyces sp. NPDC060223]|uniref:hypothetical protein n=1 Tax=unclassified Streptomyces TaxID=2593676 RepID=UPI00362EB25B
MDTERTDTERTEYEAGPDPEMRDERTPAPEAAGPDPEPDPDPEPEPKPEPKPGPEPAPKSEPDPEPKPDPDPEPVPKPEPKPDPDPDPDPDATADPAPRPHRALRAWRHPRLRWPKRIALGLVLLLVVPALGAGVALRVNYAGDPGPGTQTRNRDALWLGHAWIDGRKDDADVQALAEQLRDTGIRDLYVHAGPLEHDGTLPKSAYSQADWLIGAVHRELPGVRVQAWLGDVLASEEPEGMRLEREETRAAVVGATEQILGAGFDGVHFDLEPLHSDDQDYLSLLDDLHALTHGRGVPLSVAAHQIDPFPAANSIRGTLTGHPKWWSQAYFGQVARRVDQIALMSYDTALPLASLYGGYVAQQTSLALEVTPESTDLLMGLPFFHDDDLSHHEAAETVEAAVRGTRLGLSRTDRDRERFGVALYIDFAAEESDWAAYREGWLS